MQGFMAFPLLCFDSGRPGRQSQVRSHRQLFCRAQTAVRRLPPTLNPSQQTSLLMESSRSPDQAACLVAPLLPLCLPSQAADKR